MTCPRCGSEMQDVRANKQHPKAPDFTCTDPSCVNEKGYRTGVWLQARKVAQPVARTQGGPGLPQQQQHAPKFTWTTLGETYQRALTEARKRVVGVAVSLKLEVRLEDILTATHCLFIQACKEGVKLPPPPQEPADEWTEPSPGRQEAEV